ncbi:NAD(P)-binding domain-containing protein [Agrococcus versicolor]|uniref:NAD(P)-binding domain-containing protein n=1 Tax=Agrococcus versicolor TaxID=501482 RepID=A0ABN3APF0_9MICO
MSDLPVLVVGAGPQGLAAAAHLLERGLEPIVLERCDAAGSAVAEWGHVRLFSAWPELVDAAAARLLASTGWHSPAHAHPTGAEWVRDYLQPLADALGRHVRYGSEVTSITRRGRDKVVESGRAQQPFVVRVRATDGVETRIEARAVIDASGTWSTPAPAGADGVPAIGERAAAERISYRIPDGVDALAGRHVVVVGAGHSATHAVLRLCDLARREPTTRVTWVLRRASVGTVFGGGAADDLLERAVLGGKARRAVQTGRVALETGFRVSEIRADGDAVTVVADDGRELTDVAQVFALTGFRPDVSILSELRIALDPALEAVAGIAAEIDPNLHSCGSVGATGAAELAQPETGLFIVGAKSYGRAPTFLALTGYEQVRSVVAHLAGDEEAAARSELVLPDTGVCGGAGDFDAPTGGGCCASPALMQIVSAPAGTSA